MDNSLFVSGSQAVRDVQGVIESFAHGKRPAVQALPQGFAFQQFGNNVSRAFVRADIKNGENIWMVQSGGGQCFLLKTPQPLSIQGKSLRQDLDRHISL